jgi:carbamoyltransferase
MRASRRTPCATCLAEGGIGLRDVDYVVFYDKPLVKFERLIETYLAYAPKGLRSFLSSMPVWLKEKLYLKHLLKQAPIEKRAVSAGRDP